jgi:hypothetical protein
MIPAGGIPFEEHEPWGFFDKYKASPQTLLVLANLQIYPSFFHPLVSSNYSDILPYRYVKFASQETIKISLAVQVRKSAQTNAEVKCW